MSNNNTDNDLRISNIPDDVYEDIKAEAKTDLRTNVKMGLVLMMEGLAARKAKRAQEKQQAA